MQSLRFLAPVACAFLTLSISSTVLFAQTPVSFTAVTSTSGENPANVYAVDVNNDGLTDIVQDTGLGSPGFTVSINNGNGTFAAPVSYTVPDSSITIGDICIAAGDFNNDGNVDLALPLANTDEIAVYLGNGDGTFKSPVISTIDLPSGYTFATAGCAAADFNADGDIDLVAWTTDGGDSSPSATTELDVFQGEGNGSFNSNPHIALSSTSLQPWMQVFVGDYNSDGMADIAANVPVEDYSTGDTSSTTLYVLYGNNDFTFDETTPYIYDGEMTIGSGDLNSDGYTDLFALLGSLNDVQQLAVFYGDYQRTFQSYFIDLPSDTYDVSTVGASWDYQPQLTMADFNGDGRMDLAAIAYNQSGPLQGYAAFFLAGANPGEFTTQMVQLPTTYMSQTTPVAGLFSGNSLTPDMTFNQSPNDGSPPQNTPSYLTALLNDADSGWFGPCRYPKAGEGFDVCQAGTVSGDTALFSAAADSFGKLRKIELWVDGTKVEEQHNTWDTHAYFDWAGTFSAGEHYATFYASDIDNRLQEYSFVFDIGASDSTAKTQARRQ